VEGSGLFIGRFRKGNRKFLGSSSGPEALPDESGSVGRMVWGGRGWRKKKKKYCVLLLKIVVAKLG
jgi:hypothetical protein